jgi:ABC-type phosphate transport system substrate-binding protein
MKNPSRIRFQLAGTFVLAMLLSPSAHAECPANGLAVVVNKDNATEGLSMAQLRRLLLGDMRNWPDKKKVSLVAPDPQSSAFKCLLSSVVRMSDVEYHRFIASVQFRGEEPVDLHTANSGATAAKMVSGAPGAIGIVETGSLPAISSSVRVLRINGKQPGEAGYPL